jgi:hypothetical protein
MPYACYTLQLPSEYFSFELLACCLMLLGLLLH